VLCCVVLCCVRGLTKVYCPVRQKSCCVCCPERADVLLPVDFQFKGGIRLLKAEGLNRRYITPRNR
jgi:hypothetical protein